MHEAAERYLALVERELKRIPGIVPSEGAEDARELLTDDLEQVVTGETDVGPDELFDRIVERFGRPEDVAAAYRQRSDRADVRPMGYAPGWRMVCPQCGRSAPAAYGGLVRIGAWSPFKFILGFCRGCRRLRVFRLVNDL